MFKYSKEYFAWQKDVGAFGGWANLTKFSNFIKTTDKVVDFGCGGGFLLSQVHCAEKIGVEINPIARENAVSLGVVAHEDVSSISDDWADVIISNHALEHVHSPLAALLSLSKKLRPGGLMVFVVPCESYRTQFVPSDMHHHLYTWSPLNLGNLFLAAGLTVIECGTYLHKWPPYYKEITHVFGRRGFELACWIYGWLRRDLVQIRVIASRPF